MSAVEYFLGFDPFIQKVLMVGMLFFGLAVLSLLLTSWFRFYNGRRASTWLKAEVHWKRVLVEALYGSPQEIPKLNTKIETLQFIKLWTEYHEKIRGQASEALNVLAAQVFLSEHALRLLKQPSMLEKLPAIVALGHLREQQAFDLIKTNIGEKDSSLSLISARALLQIDSDRALPMLLPLMAQRRDWPDARLATMLHEAGPNVVSKHLPSYLLEHSGPSSSRLIPFLKYIQPGEQTPVAASILEHSGDDISKVECLPLLQFPDDVKYANSFLNHANPKFRKAAIGLLAKLGSAQDISSLNKLAFDPDLGVRFDAIRAIEKLDDANYDALRNLGTNLDNTITQQMISEARKQGEIS